MVTRDSITIGRVGYQVLGFNWTCIYVNPAAAHQRATTPEALVGRTVWEAWPQIEGTAFAEALRTCMRQRVSRTFDHSFAGGDGGQRWFNVRIEPSHEGLTVYSIDIHDRKATEAEGDPVPVRRGFSDGVLRRLIDRVSVRRGHP